jgi:hypothetical protein
VAVLDTNVRATSAQDTWYDVFARCDDDEITVYRMEQDSSDEMELVLSTSQINATCPHLPFTPFTPFTLIYAPFTHLRGRAVRLWSRR